MITEVGLALNIVGTLLIAYSFGVFDRTDFGAGGYTTDSKGRKHEIAYFIHPKWFRIGIVLLILGFLLQLSIIQDLLAQIRFR